MTKKVCNRCRRKKSLRDFYLRKRKDGSTLPTSWCKHCYREKTAIWNKQHKTKAREAQWNVAVKARYAKIKDAVFGAYGGYRCNCCGETERAFLIIDHVANNGAAWRREKFGSRLATGRRTYHWLFKNGFPAGFQVLCYNCNVGKHLHHGICPHQAKCNDYALEAVESSDSKRTASADEYVH